MPSGLSGPLYHQLVVKITDFSSYALRKKHELWRQHRSRQKLPACTGLWSHLMGMPCRHTIQEQESYIEYRSWSTAHYFLRVFLSSLYASFHTIRLSPSLTLCAAGSRVHLWARSSPNSRPNLKAKSSFCRGRSEGLEQTTRQANSRTIWPYAQLTCVWISLITSW